MNLADARPRDDFFTPLGDWINKAACRDVNPDLFVWDGTAAASDLLRAASLCAVCPVRFECDADAVANHSLGVWGGKLRRGGRASRPVNLVARLGDTKFWTGLRSNLGPNLALVDEVDVDGAA